MKDTYQTLLHPATGEYKEKGSKFIAYAQAIYKEADIKLFLADIKKEHPKARHHCYAYRLGLDKLKNYRANDDGEPSGTAGKPILGQIDSMGVSNIMIIVVRYFGGTKLGVPGLIRSYKTASRDALEKGKIITKQVTDCYEISFDYIKMNLVMRLLKKEQLSILEQTYDNACKIKIQMRQSEQERIIQALEKIDTLEANYLYTQ